MTYSFYTKPANTPQNKAIPGREAEMVAGKSGAVAFKATEWMILRRSLIMGTNVNGYYSEKDLKTRLFIETLSKCMELDPEKVGEEITYASDGHAINNHTPILALAFLSTGNPKAKKVFKSIFSKVIRTQSHFHEWVNYTKSIRGMGKIIRETGKNWFNREDVKWLTYQCLKYGSRYDYSVKDELRIFKPSPKTEAHDHLFGYLSDKKEIGILADPSNWTEQSTNQILWYEWLKQNPSEGVRAVKEGGLTHEMVSPICEMGSDVWQELFQKMPIGALLRNLGSLTEIGVIDYRNTNNIRHIQDILLNPERVRKGRIHPIDALKALKVYQSNGSMGRSKKTWNAIPAVSDILEGLVSLSFDCLEPTGKVFCHAIDISGSMSWNPLPTIGLKCSEIAATMALATVKAEDNYYIKGFARDLIDLSLSKQDSFSSATKKVSNKTIGSTNATSVYNWAQRTNSYVDVFCFYTDSESYGGTAQLSQALDQYRKKVNPTAKAVYVTLEVNRLAHADPRDPYAVDFGGFDPSIPKAIQEFALL